jgi:hypothetical protein
MNRGRKDAKKEKGGKEEDKSVVTGGSIGQM